VPAEVSAFVVHSLRQSGIEVPPEEAAGLAASLPLVRHNTDLIYTVADARDELPGFDAPADAARREPLSVLPAAR
jgi:hypothetical protein